MLTLKLLRENPEFVIAKLAVKNFDAKEIVEKINDLDQNRRALQVELDSCLSEQKKKAAEIGGLMKTGKREEAEAVKAEVAALKARSSEIEKKSQENNTELESLLVLLPNIPCDQVPEGKGAEDNVVVKSGNEIPELGENCLPHWELAKKYNLIDFDWDKISEVMFHDKKADGDTVAVTTVNEIGKYETKTLKCNQVIDMAKSCLGG